MPFQLQYHRHDLQFKFAARTSRGSLTTHTVYYLKLSNSDEPGIFCYGEAAPLAGLSVDHRPDFENRLAALCRTFNTQNLTLPEAVETWFAHQDLVTWPALKFAFETAWLDYKNGGRKMLFDTGFSRGETGIPINGLIWMGDEAFMQEQIEQKLNQGFDCLKLKIGGLDFQTELRILKSIREVANQDKLTIRLDANGAFKPEEALEKLEKLAAYHIHSIEQPIKPNQPFAMRNICAKSPIPVALDEELIGVALPAKRRGLLQYIQPQYIILKPTLVGGLSDCRKWISLAEKMDIGWWITSALESNIGLNAIAQFTSTFENPIPQGLGTGQLYHNNIPSPLVIEQGKLFYKTGGAWDIGF
ncbi:o-succinylbenzoate synthase [Adhaeribacter soli]|uniref:O-succinylbenzoate synthase n=1 Tax=Adhaeribacter soli TaxID=2607655 RepID=A0A5N1J9P7_9BACT|nr:o-succinylbenzoate synthase [Adhaeribacter soli]KAA9346035.1 o-succinylbenzoate synthase [Adhaeribacter soli]